MGRKKIQITRIVDERNRQVTFMKRKFGLMKKAYELSVLCDCEIALIIFNGSNKLFQYASTDMDKVLLKYTEYNEPHESRTNSDIVEALNKKEHRGCDSPDADGSYTLTPTTEEKYKRINEEFDNMMKTHKISAGLPQQSFMHVAPGSMPYGSIVTSQALPGATAAFPDNGILSSPHTHLHRSLNSPQRSPSTGHTVNGFAGSPGSSMGKTIASKSPSPPPPPPPSGNIAVCPGQKTDLRVVVPQSKGMMQTVGNHRAISSPSSQPLSTPVVSITTPSMTHQSLVYSSINAAYNNDYLLNSGELSGFSSPVGSIPAWQHQLGSLGSANSSAPISTSQNISIKAEPGSPPHDHHSQSGYMTQAHSSSHHSSTSRGRSPVDSVSSSCSSHDGGSDREEQQRQDFLSLPAGQPENPTIKRMRMDSWVT
ncbi:myocyte-specific enhancer factor 2A-like [Takifugu flavidus]|uniref:MADS-box domain-containing protein n=2 Tax=Takifugu TaxID=31032 RepID=A0A4Z2BET2_9TELE|nr:myocyte-specific enhancer factor 2A-like [Takifugu flavidus]XP_056881097.1 myocyte-specific enhancer factor 2A-like [Takifugu flavidus]TNM90472.1 hypothetical protein fugu_002761 [Takifugu bimaculatus]